MNQIHVVVMWELIIAGPYYFEKKNSINSRRIKKEDKLLLRLYYQGNWDRIGY